MFSRMAEAFRPLLGALLTLLLALSPSALAFEQPESESGLAPKPLVKAQKQMVVTAHPLAAEAALGTLRKGGSATDAGIAAQMVLNLVEPQSSGIGGGAFILTWDARMKRIASYDGRETAPSVTTPELFIDAAGNQLPKGKAIASGLSVGVPGALAALKLAHVRHGKLAWADLFEPAIALARNGFPISPRLAKMLAEADPATFTPDARAHFFDADGRPWPSGYKLKNQALAETFATIAHEGPDAFYRGDNARDIAAAVQNDPRIPGSLSAKDLSSYRAKEREPVCVPYRAYRVCGAGPPSSGAVAVGQVLGLITPFDLGTAPAGAEAVHLIAEAERLALADRGRYLADPDFVAVPVAGLLDAHYLAERRALIDPARALEHVTAGTPPGTRADARGRDATREGAGTSQISIVDDAGNAFSMTTSIEFAFGARSIVRGFLLNNQLTDFSFAAADVDGRAIANRVEAGKRPRSSMSPTIVLGEGDALRYVLGSPGGPGIILFNLKALVALIDWGLDPAKAAALVNFGSNGRQLLLETGAEWDGLEAALRAKGHDVKRMDLTSGLHIVAVTPEGLEGGADPRREGIALGD